VTVILDDHLLRDWMVGDREAVRDAVGGEEIATTNLWYVRLCKSAARTETGALLGVLRADQRQLLVGALIEPNADIEILPIRELAWRMGVLSSEGRGLSTLGAEAVAAAESFSARLLVSSRDDAPAVRRCCLELGIPYATLTV
jgi:hypothetical protein